MSESAKAATALKMIQAKKAKLELDEKQGLLIKKEDVGEILENIATKTRESLLRIPAKCSLKLSKFSKKSECEDYLQKEIESALKELSQYEH